VALVAQRLAEDRGMSVEAVAAQTTKNAKGLFGIG
jgi:Tat protein secretion system quality control protein TatD with DNase activity